MLNVWIVAVCICLTVSYLQVFSRNRYHSFGSVAGDEPILCCGGLGKRCPMIC